MARWSEGEDHQRIGDIMVKNAPFLKMYTEYVKNFDTAMNTINSLYTKNSKFAAIVDEIHVSRDRNRFLNIELTLHSAGAARV